jgi:hypothetical protein
MKKQGAEVAKVAQLSYAADDVSTQKPPQIPCHIPDCRVTGHGSESRHVDYCS